MFIKCKSLMITVLISFCSFGAVFAQDHITLEGGEGLGKGKHIVFLAGDEEYRSEEAMPLMAYILNKQGFKCTVLFSINEETGFVDPNNQKSLTNPAALDSADALVMSLRFRNWNDETMTKFEAAINRGVALIGLRTTTHAFNFPKTSKWFKYSYNASAESGWSKGFGREIMGETWINHHGVHKKEGTRSFVEEANKGHEILKSVGTIFGDSDVYGANPNAAASTKILLRGGVTTTLESDSPLVEGAKNTPMMPIAWVREYKNSAEKVNRVFTTTMGAATDLKSEGLRRLVGNAVFWGLNLTVPENLNVDLPVNYKPTFYSFKGFQKDKKPNDFNYAVPTAEAKPNQSPSKDAAQFLPLEKATRLMMIGGNLGSRMMNYGYFETEVYVRNPDKNLVIRNMCDGGDTPGFRPHSAKNSDKHFAFPGAEKFYPEFAKGAGAGFNETPDQWLTRLQADVIIGFFGFSESFKGEAGLAKYEEELQAFINHTNSQKYNGKSAPKLALVSPVAFQDLSSKYDFPNGVQENVNIALYKDVMKKVAEKNGILFVDAFTPSKQWYASGEELTIDGSQLNQKGYEKFSAFLANALFGETQKAKDETLSKNVLAAVNEKNWYWHNDYKIPNGVHVFGRRYNPFGPANYPFEIKKIRQMTDNRDQAIWSILQNKPFDLAKVDAQSDQLPEVKTNFKGGDDSTKYLTPENAVKTLTVPQGYKIEVFASEVEFPDLANPVQMSFDDKGRLWVAVMPSYPHWKPGDAKPNDKLIILEDTNGDGKADKQITFADHLNLPIGFEFVPGGVYVTQGTNLVLLKDTNGDDKADVYEIILSGFDDHDTHHAISAYCADPSGSFLMGEGVFLSTHVETSYGTIRGTDGGFFRFDPVKRKLERTAQLNIPNPWGIAFDEYGQNFFLHTSGTTLSWMDPYKVKAVYGQNLRTSDLLKDNKVRPTSGLEFISSRHFPDEVQGDIVLCNNIGFRGAKQHQFMEDGTGFTTKFRHDLFVSSDPNFRPVDLEIAPDGSLYVIDWQNVLIGHMQHNARDPNRDHVHGRVYRVTYPSRPLVTPAKVYGATIPELLENLKLPEYRTRYRSRRVLRGHDVNEVVPAVKTWVANLDKSAPLYEKYLLEALWVTWGINKVDNDILNSCLNAKDHRVRAAAVHVVHYNTDKLTNHKDLLIKATQDEHGRVRNVAIVAASHLDKEAGLAILAAAAAKDSKMDSWNKMSYDVSMSILNNTSVKEVKVVEKTHLKGKDKDLFFKGKEIYNREGHCVTCHQPDGNGLQASGFPPLAKTNWVLESEERLIKLVLKGVMGPMEVNGVKYSGLVPMTPFEGMLNDDDVAAVLTYVRNSFGNNASVISPATVKKVRAEVKDKVGFFSAEELLKVHPHKK